MQQIHLILITDSSFRTFEMLIDRPWVHILAANKDEYVFKNVHPPSMADVCSPPHSRNTTAAYVTVPTNPP